VVFILDQGSVFDAPLEKIWRLFSTPSEHKHPSMKNLKVERTPDPAVRLMEWEGESQGTVFPIKWRMIFFPPIGFVIDYLEGPLAGSKEFEYYVPMGDKTGITCVGEFKGAGISDAKLRAAVMDLYEQAFREDQDNLARMK
jgi:hypothetical protein